MTSTNTSNELARLALRDPDLLRDRSLIAGVWRCADDGSECVVSNPATGARIGSVPDMGGAETRAAIDAAAAALPAWARRTAKERAGILLRLHRLMLENRTTSPV